MAALRVVLAEDNYLMREGIVSMFTDVGDVDLVAAVANAPELLAAVKSLRPNAVLTDIRMPPSFETEGIVAAKAIRAQYPDTGVVVLSQFVEEDYVFELLSEGVAGIGYLLKERIVDLDELVRALREVARGGSVLDPKVVERLMSRNEARSTSPLGQLTQREREVLQVMATGQTNAAIAKTLFMSERAVEKHVGAVFQKLGLIGEGEVNRRVMAVLAFLEATKA
jgi:DNA-binding NarL/FixJ family response regulator